MKKEKFLLLFQVHDFAEDHRPDRLKLLLECSGNPDRLYGTKIAYPLWKNIIYLTINSRDKTIQVH